MPTDPLADDHLSAELLEALLPILHRIHVERTLSPGKVGILRHLERHGRASTADLATAVQVSPQAISLATRELEGLGLVTRVPDEQDRRRSWTHLTEAGRRTFAEEVHTGRAWLHRAVQDRLTPAERRTLAAAVPLLAALTPSPGSGPGAGPEQKPEDGPEDGARHRG